MATHNQPESDHYDSDDEIYATVADATKHVVYVGTRVEILDVASLEIEQEEDRLAAARSHREFITRDMIDRSIDDAYYEVMGYVRSLGLPLLDGCSLSTFRTLYD
uniref:Uncharacterized protein n=1 Tax=viral metagenome TaxID=1070528 RepID=A0A6C0LZW6_9ZZZZ